jgi:hypothetical protein
MKTDKLVKLFKSASHDSSPPASPDFIERVMRQVRQTRRPQPLSLVDCFAALFPRLAFGAAAAIVLCILIDFADSKLGGSDFSEAIAQISAQWTLP